MADLEERDLAAAKCWQSGKLKREYRRAALGRMLLSLRIWLLSLVYFGVSTTMYGVTCGCRA